MKLPNHLNQKKISPANVRRRNRNLLGQNRGGFTLVELVVVMTIIVVLGGSAIFLITGFVDDAKYQRVDSDIKTIDMAIKRWESGNFGKPPTQEQGLAALTEKPTTGPVPKRWRAYLEEKVLDPWGTEYQYRFPATKSKKRYDIYSFGEDGVESADDVGNW